MPREFNAPVVGDASICLNCGTVLVFTEQLTVRRAEAKDFENWPDDIKGQLLKAMVARHLSVPPHGLYPAESFSVQYHIHFPASDSAFEAHLSGALSAIRPGANCCAKISGAASPSNRTGPL